jgi:hypothetical protein
MKYDDLSQEQRRFAFWLHEKMPQLLPLFDFNKRELKCDKIDSILMWSNDCERIMANFIMSVWTGSDDFDFDLFDACKRLDRENIKIIRDWLLDPIWP